jgi:hypothetical protein
MAIALMIVTLVGKHRLSNEGMDVLIYDQLCYKWRNHAGAPLKLERETHYWCTDTNLLELQLVTWNHGIMDTL